MTAIACWISKESGQEFLFMVGDSRVSDDGKKLTDHCAKIFSLPVLVRPIPSAENFTPMIDHTQKVGFAYAGSSLIGLNTAAVLGSVLSGMSRIGPRRPLCVGEISEIARQTFELICLDITTTRGATSSEAALCAYCPVHDRFEMFRLWPDTSNPEKFKIGVTLIPPTEILQLGEKIAEIRDLIEARMSALSRSHGDWGRVPKQVLEELIRTDAYATTGGVLQIALDNKSGVELYASCVPIMHGQPQARMVIQGFDLANLPEPKNHLLLHKAMT